MADWIGVDVTETTCGHQPHAAKGLCRNCYRRTYEREKDRERLRAWQAANREKTRESARAYAAAHREQEAARAQAWREDNPERFREANRAWRAANPNWAREYKEANAEQIAKRQREYRQANPEKQREQNRAWRKANPERARDKVNRRRARKNGVGADLTHEQWQAILIEFAGHCAYCDEIVIPLQQEHMMPLSRGGRHTASNVVPACGACNARKNTKTAQEFAGWVIPPRRERGTAG